MSKTWKRLGQPFSELTCNRYAMPSQKIVLFDTTCHWGFFIYKLGVTCIWANRGVSEEILEEAFRAFRNNHVNQVSVGINGPSNGNNNNKSDDTSTSNSTLSLNSVDSDESQSETTVIYVHKRRGSRASITYDIPPVIDRSIRLRGRRMSAPALSIPPSLTEKKLIACPEIVEN